MVVRFRSRQAVPRVVLRRRRRRRSGQPAMVRLDRQPSFVTRWARQRRAKRGLRIDRPSAYTRWQQKRRAQRGLRIERPSAFARWRQKRRAERGLKLERTSRFKAWRMARRPSQPTLKIDKPSFLARKLRERRAKRGFVAKSPGFISRLWAKRRATKGFVGTTLTFRQRVSLGVVMVAAVSLLVVARLPSGKSAQVGVGRTTNVAMTTVPIPTTTLPPADPSVCSARDQVLFTAAIDLQQGREAVAANLEAMLPAMTELVEADEHEALAAAAAQMVPIIEDALTVLSDNPDDSPASLADEFGFTDPEILGAMGTVLSYPLNCTSA